MPIIHDWHDPYSATCGQNIDIAFDCTCKRKMNRKPYRVCRIKSADVPHGIDAEIVLEVHPNGVLVFRNKRKRQSYTTTAGSVFAGLVWRDAMNAAKAKKAARRARK